MPVPAAFTDLSTTASSNSPAGTDNIGTTADDYLRSIQAVIRQGLAHKGSDIVSAASMDLGAVAGNYHDITGSTGPITSFGTVSAGIWKVLQFDSTPTLTHNASSLVLPGAANIVAKAGDHLLAISLGSGNWRVPWYVRADGTTLLNAGNITALTTLDSVNDKLTVYDNSAAADRSMPVQVLFRKNAIINGAFNISQRGAVGTGITDGTFVSDRFFWSQAGAGVFDSNSASTDVPTVAEAGRKFNQSLLIDCTTADASLAAGDVYGVAYLIEGYDWAHFAQRDITLSFWVKSTKTGTFCVGFTNGGLDRSYVAEYTVSTTATWEKKTITVTASPSAGTWDYVAGGGLRIVWTIAAGTTFQASAAGAWENGNFVATSNQVNGADANTNDFRITGIQLEIGSVATEFEYRDFSTELEMCHRYFQKSYSIDVALGTVTNNGTALWTNFFGAPSGGSVQIYPKVAFRVAPTVTAYNPTTGGTGTWRNGAANPAATGTNISTNVFTVNLGAVTAGTSALGHWIADAEI